MNLPIRARRWTAAAALTLLTLGPLATPSRAGDGPASGGSVAGALMAIACGASARVAVMTPAPIVIVVTAVICSFAMLDAWHGSDAPPA